MPLHEPAGGRTALPDFRDTWDFFGAGDQYATDQLGGMPVEQWYVNVLAGVSPDDVDITVRPCETPDGEPITWSDGNSWAIPTQSQNPEAACALARLTNQRRETLWALIFLSPWLIAAHAVLPVADRASPPASGRSSARVRRRGPAPAWPSAPRRAWDGP